MVKQACGNPKCGVSTGICERPTFGSGELDSNGYWEVPCSVCARAWEAKNGLEEGQCWPPSQELDKQSYTGKTYFTSAAHAGYGARIWLCDYTVCPFDLWDELGKLSKWGGHDKSDGVRRSFEFDEVGLSLAIDMLNKHGYLAVPE